MAQRRYGKFLISFWSTLDLILDQWVGVQITRRCTTNVNRRQFADRKRTMTEDSTVNWTLLTDNKMSPRHLANRILRRRVRKDQPDPHPSLLSVVANYGSYSLKGSIICDNRAAMGQKTVALLLVLSWIIFLGTDMLENLDKDNCVFSLALSSDGVSIQLSV
jgi:hypothetical protein